MSASSTEIANLALLHLAIQFEMQELDTEKTMEATVIRRFYDRARKETLRGFQWPFATRIVSLQAVAGPNPPATTEWQMSYRMPQDLLRAQRILSGIRMDDQDSRIPYKIGADDEGGLIYTDQQVVVATTETPQLPLFEYTLDVSDESTFPEDFVKAFAFLLAFYAAPSLTKGDEFGLGKRAYTNHTLALADARVNAMNEQQPDRQPESEFIREREGGSASNAPTPMIRSI